jgi:RNA polymerase sigma factor (sigma-70 family)
MWCMDIMGGVPIPSDACPGGRTLSQEIPRDINDAVDRFHEPLVRFLYYLVRDQHYAEDLAQTIWLQIHARTKQHDPSRGSYWTWLCWLARQRAFVHNRAARNHPQITLDEKTSGHANDRSLDPWIDKRSPDPFLEVVGRETEERVRWAFMQLSDPYRETACLFYLERMPCEEIALVAGCRVGTIYSRLDAARRRLRELLDTPNP